MRVSVLGSIFLHVFILLFTVLSLPLFNNNDLEMPPVIQVELIEIAEKTNVPQISKKIEEQKYMHFSGDPQNVFVFNF